MLLTLLTLLTYISRLSRASRASSVSSVSRWVASWIYSINDKVSKVASNELSRYRKGVGSGKGVGGV